MTDRETARKQRRGSTERRRFLQSIGAIGAIGWGRERAAVGRAGGLEGATGSRGESVVEIAYDPYDGVDWSAVTQHKCEFHNHVRGPMTEPAEIVDLYHELGYTVYAAADHGTRPIKWPWTAFSAVDGSFEDRDPAELGVVAFPGCEFELHEEHVCSLFSTLTHADVDASSVANRWDQAHQIVDRTDHYVPPDVGGLAVVAHPFVYYAAQDAGWERYRTDFESRTREQGMVGLEVFNRASIFGHDVGLWDALLTSFAPERMIWGFGVDDPKSYELGSDVDVNWTTVLLDDAEFDPTDQPGSRRAAANAITAGRTLVHRRDTWDPDTAEPASVPRVRSITVDRAAGELSIDASDYEGLGWVSNGDVVSSDETLSLAPDHAPYVRAHLVNDGGETSTQPIGLAAR